jgi:ferredoxin
MELKTVQIMDELEIGRPCIDMEDEGYNTEWSQELKLEESVREYVKAWILIPVIRRLLGWDGAGTADGTIFNLSVGYDLEGILQPRMQKFLDVMTGADDMIAEYIEEIAKNHPEFADVKAPGRVSRSCTLSTMHGCPPDEVGRIAAYLLGERGFHLSVKLNPTLMGPDFVRGTLRDTLGYESVDIPDSMFEHDLKFAQAVDIIKSMQDLAERKNLYFGVKLSNTLAMRNTKGFLPGNEMYMSGRPIYPITVNLWNKLNKAFGGDLSVSYSAGADAENTPLLLRCGAKSVTVATDILKPGGYSRFPQYIHNIFDEMSAIGASNLKEFAADRTSVLETAAASALKDPKYAKKSFRGLPKAKSPLTKFDCAMCRRCAEVCPNRANVTFNLSPVSVTLPLLSASGNTLRPSETETETFVTKQGKQILHIEDLCNECGNCGIFCVHQGLPYRDKPALCLNDKTFGAANPDGKDLFRLSPGQVRRRVNGREESLSVTERGCCYSAEGVSVEMDIETGGEAVRNFKVTSAEPGGAGASGNFSLSLRGAAEMWVIYSGVSGSLPWLLDY